MVEGITVLNKIAITGLPSWIIVSSVVILAIGLIVLVVSLLAEWPAWAAIVPIISAVLIFIICGILNCIVKTGEYRYECTIDDSVSYNEVVENYKIVKQRGDIWVLEDK